MTDCRKRFVSGCAKGATCCWVNRGTRKTKSRPIFGFRVGRSGASQGALTLSTSFRGSSCSWIMRSTCSAVTGRSCLTKAEAISAALRRPSTACNSFATNSDNKYCLPAPVLTRKWRSPKPWSKGSISTAAVRRLEHWGLSFAIIPFMVFSPSPIPMDVSSYRQSFPPQD